MTFLDFAQAYAVGETGALSPGTEVVSLLRDSPLPPEDYATRFFDTGGEHQGVVEPGE
ncbi:hypothetical protein [Amycolatopsis sp. DSM 110486]|uniref:hypothetical protein n=1 Tax=Amycolatopsis sp. DSM 110486 TaxID=2865832 RepID=UPI001C6A287B|nr:hypothetical protein [Amycolatopsis sp. DSM 110486]QYN17831.1 hypothetical protein K1T34_34355 [Amycolatopsis sp. DSM 110486]